MTKECLEFEAFAREYNLEDEMYLEQEARTVYSRTPGRFDVMGGIADYSGSIVLQMPIREATFVAAQQQLDPTINIVSVDPTGAVLKTSIGVYQFNEISSSYKSAGQFFHDSAARWSAYIIGTLVALVVERNLRVESGIRILIRSDVPIGKGVSSSAALEAACMSCLARLFDVRVEDLDLARYCQRVENRIVGAACGIMDQMSVVFGRKSSLMRLRCQPDIVEGHISLPSDVAIWGIDSGIQHTVAGDTYTSVRVGAFMGLQILRSHGYETIKYLANITPDHLGSLKDVLPERVSGHEFNALYENWTDPVTTVDLLQTYPVKQATMHPILENDRVGRFARLIEDGARESLACAGRLMYESHDGYSMCGLGSDETDRLVDMVKEIGAENGLYGARISGGGSGGTVVILGDPVAEHHVKAIASKYAEETNLVPNVFTGTSGGCSVWG